MSRKYVRTGLGLLVVVAGAWGGRYVTARVRSAGAPMSTEHAQARAIARQMLDRLAAPGFVGIIGFRFESRSLSDAGSGVFDQYATLCVGENAVRLDAWLQDGSVPIICCVKSNEAWMIWPGAQFVERSPYPFTPDLSGAGWRGQLYLQARQTTGWAEILLNGGLPGACVISDADVSGESLSVRLEGQAAQGGNTPLSIEAALVPGTNRYFPSEIRFASGMVLALADPQVFASGTTLAARLSTAGTTRCGEVRESHWTVVSLDERQVDDSELLGFFDPPSNLDGAFPELLGVRDFDRQGNEHIVMWQ